MKKSVMNIVSILILAFAGFTTAQSLESLLESHFKIVGQEKMLSVNSIVSKGNLKQGGLDIELTSYILRPDKYRLEGRYEGFTFVEVYDGTIGWTYNQMLGDEEPKLLSEGELEILKAHADIDGLLYNYKEKGFTIELLEPESVGNVLADVVLLSKADGLKISYFLDSESGVIIKSRTVAVIAGEERIYESVFRDYRYVNQILFPFSVDVYFEGELIMEFTYSSIELNANIEDYRFNTPESLKEKIEDIEPEY